MKRLVEKPFLQIFFDYETRTMHVIRPSETENMTAEAYKTDTMEWAKIILDLKPVKILVDETEMKYGIKPELQDFMQKNLIIPAIGAGLKYVAMIVSKDLFSQVSIEQILEDKPSHGLTIRFFDEASDAIDWLKKHG